MHSTKLTLYTIAFLTSVLYGCTASLSNLQNPKVLDPGQVSTRVGATFLGSLPPSNDLALNIGILRRVEFEAKTDVQSYTLSLRYQLIDSPYVTIAFSKLGIQSKLIQNEYESNPTGALWLPSILVGRDHWYIGAKAAYSTFAGHIQGASRPIIFQNQKWNSYTITGGAIITTSDVNILLEIDDYISPFGSPILIPAIGFSRVL